MAMLANLSWKRRNKFGELTFLASSSSLAESTELTKQDHKTRKKNALSMSVLLNVQKGFNSCDEIERERNIARRVKTEQMLENTSTRRG